MPTKRWFTCQVCLKPFWSYRSDAPKSCGPECARKRNLEVLQEIQPRKAPVTNVCEICGMQFVGRNRRRAYKACDSPECRAAIRKKAGRKSGSKAQGTVERSCLRCDQKFKARDRFTRICPKCKKEYRSSSESKVYAEAWGGTI